MLKWLCVGVCFPFLEVCSTFPLSSITDTVQLTQFPEDTVCSKQQLLYNCTTGGPAIVWIVDGSSYVFNSVDQINARVEHNGFIFSLIDINLPNYFGSLTIESVLSELNGTHITCSNGDDFHTRVIIVAGMIELQIAFSGVTCCQLEFCGKLLHILELYLLICNWVWS